MNSVALTVRLLTLSVVVEVPRWTNAKLEISKEEAFNPIKQGTATVLIRQGYTSDFSCRHQEGQAPIRQELLPPPR